MTYIEIISLTGQEYTNIHKALLTDERVDFINGIVMKKRRSWLQKYRAASISELAKKYDLAENYVKEIAQLGIDVQVKIVTGYGSFHQLVFALIESILKQRHKSVAISDIGYSPHSSERIVGMLAILEPVIQQHHLQVRYYAIGLERGKLEK